MQRLTKTLTALTACGLLATGTANAETIQVNFGEPGVGTSASNWNNVEISNNSNSGDAGSTLPNLVTSTGANSGITLTVERDATTNPEIQFGGGGSESVTLSGPAAGIFPDDVGSSYAWVSGGSAGYGGGPYPLGVITLSGLTPGDIVDFDLISFRAETNGADGRRLGTFEFIGLNSGSIDLDATHDGSGGYGSVDGIVADGNGEIRFEVTHSTAAADPDGYGYLNGMVMNVVPEPGSLALLGLGGLMLIGRRRTASQK